MVFQSTGTGDLRLVFQVVERCRRGAAGEVEGRLHAAQKIAGADADPDDEDCEWGEGEDFADVEIVNFVVVMLVGFFEGAEENSLDEPEHIPGTEDDAGDGKDGDGRKLRGHEGR